MVAQNLIAKEVGRAAIRHGVGVAAGAALGAAKKIGKHAIKASVSGGKKVAGAIMNRPKPKPIPYAAKKLLSEKRALSYGDLAATKTRK